MEDTIRVLRVIEYTGPRDKVEDQVARSLHGEKRLNNGVTIRAATVGSYPELLENAPPTFELGHPENSGNNFGSTRTTDTELLSTLKALVHQIDLGNAVDDMGHELKNLKALNDAKILITRAEAN